MDIATAVHYLKQVVLSCIAHCSERRHILNKTQIDTYDGYDSYSAFVMLRGTSLH